MSGRHQQVLLQEARHLDPAGAWANELFGRAAGGAWWRRMGALVTREHERLLYLGEALRDRPDTAEPALLVEDRYQGQGIGSRLYQALVDEAQAHGVHYFDAMAHASNGPMLHLLRRCGDPTRTVRDGGVLTMLVALSDDG